MRAERVPRLVAMDLDGTLLRSDGTISPRTEAALERIEQAGARFVFVTGRPPRHTVAALEPFGYQGVAICANGALAYDLRQACVVSERLIPARRLAEVAVLLRQAIPDLGLAVERSDGQLRDLIFQGGAFGGRDVIVPRLPDEQLFRTDAVKLLGRHPSLTADELLTLAAPAVGELVTVYHSGGSRLLEVTALGVTKGSALAELAAQLGLSADQVVAFGDMVNDLPMLDWAGTSYGMANGHPDVLAMVDQVIPGNDEDGVATIIEQLFP